jgi:hypothetical protein
MPSEASAMRTPFRDLDGCVCAKMTAPRGAKGLSAGPGDATSQAVTTRH